METKVPTMLLWVWAASCCWLSLSMATDEETLHLLKEEEVRHRLEASRQRAAALSDPEEAAATEWLSPVGVLRSVAELPAPSDGEKADCTPCDCEDSVRWPIDGQNEVAWTTALDGGAL